MNKKRVSIFLLSFLTLSILAITLVAAPEGPNTGEIVTGIQEFFEPVLASIFGESSDLFEQLLFALLIVAFVYMALDRVPIISDNSFALWAAAIASAILAVRFIATEKLVNLLLLPQGAMGVALLTIIPFVIYFWFVEFGLTSKTLRKAAWAVYAAVWMVLWYKQVYGTATIKVPAGWEYMYLIAAGIAVIAMIADRRLQRTLKKIKEEKNLSTANYLKLSKLHKERDEVHDAYLDAVKRGDRGMATDLKDRLGTMDSAIDTLST